MACDGLDMDSSTLWEQTWNLSHTYTPALRQQSKGDGLFPSGELVRPSLVDARPPPNKALQLT